MRDVVRISHYARTLVRACRKGGASAFQTRGEKFGLVRAIQQRRQCLAGI